MENFINSSSPSQTNVSWNLIWTKLIHLNGYPRLLWVYEANSCVKSTRISSFQSIHGSYKNWMNERCTLHCVDAQTSWIYWCQCGRSTLSIKEVDKVPKFCLSSPSQCLSVHNIWTRKKCKVQIYASSRLTKVEVVCQIKLFSL